MPFIVNCQTNNTISNVKAKSLLLNTRKGIIDAISELPTLQKSKNGIIQIKVPEQTQDDCNFIQVKKYIPLETTKDFLIGSVMDRIDICDHKIYILDRQSNSVFIFSDDGKFKRAIHDVGRGPKQYLQLASMYISEENKNIILYCRQLHRFLYYDLEGNALSVKNTILWFKDFSMFPSGEYCYYLDKAYDNSDMLLITDANKNIPTPVKKGIDGMSNINPNVNYFTSGSYFKDFQKAKLIMPAFKDTLYQFTKDTVFAKYALNYGNHKVPPDYLRSKTDFLLKKLEKDGNKAYYSLGDFFETDKFVGFGFYTGKKPYDLIYCKKTGNIYFGTIRDKNSDIIIYSPFNTIGSKLISYMEPEGLLYSYNKNLDKNLPTDFVDICKKIRKNDNPVVLLLDFEEF
jgi:hypothetical protein